MNPCCVNDGSLWMIRREAFDAIRLAVARPYAGLVPGQSPAQPPPYPDRDSAGPGYDLTDGVAVIPVYGPIYRHSTFLDDLMAWAFGGVSVDRLADGLRAALNDPLVRSILFTFDSPGGIVSGTGELAGLIRKAGAVKPVAAYCESCCCSAAYHLACAAGEITAAPSAIIGSIGTVVAWIDDTEMMRQLGLKQEVVVSKQSPNKWLDPTSDEGRAQIQKLVDDTADLFVADVARGRNVPVATVLSDFGQGGVMLAAEAKKAGMIDKVGSFADVLAKLSGPNRGRLAVKRAAASTPITARSAATPFRVRLVPQRPGRA